MEQGIGGSGGRGRRGARFDRDWTKGSIIRNLLSLSWPVVVTDSLRMVGPTIDMIWVARLGAASIAGVGVSGIIVMLLTGAKMGLNTGARALIARFIGAGDEEGANHVAQQALVLTTIYALVVGVIGFFLAEEILALMGLEADVVAQGAAYMRLMFINQAVNGFLMLSDAIMQASGDTVTPMKLTVIARVVHIALDPFLIFGWWFFPRLGVSGAAVANIIGFSVATGIAVWFLSSGQTRLRLSVRGFRLDPAMIWRIVKIGVPASIMGLERSLGRLLLMRILTPFGTRGVAAFSLTERIENLLFMPSTALGVAGGVLIGQNLGAGQPERAERSGWLGAGLAEVVLVAISAALLLWPEAVIHIFTSDPEIVKVTSAFVRIETIGYAFMGLNGVLRMCISGAGDTLPPMLVTLLSVWGVQLPLAFFLSQNTNLGVYGVPWAIAANLIIGAIAYSIYFKLGRWKRKQV